MGDLYKGKQRLSKNAPPVMRPEPRSSSLRHLTRENFDLKPLYQMKPRHLIDYHVEKPVQYLGEMDGISPDLDITNRTDVLRIVDKGKKQGAFSIHVSHDHYDMLSLSVFNMEISKFSTTQDLLLRIPVHEIAGVCYIKDDQYHILVIKFGTQASCKLALLYCESKSLAEEICALVNQCFTLIYNEAAVNSIERHIIPAERFGNGPDSVPVPRTNQIDVPHSYYVHSERGSGRDSFSDTGAGKELLEDYMKKLTTRLTQEELLVFLQHLNHWKNDSHFTKFCDEVLHLLGPERKQLISDLLPFIPSDKYQYFEEFLRRNDIQLLENTSTLSGSQTDVHSYSTRRSLSEVSTTSSLSNNLASGDALDHLLDLAKAQYNSVEVDVPEDYS